MNTFKVVQMNKKEFKLAWQLIRSNCGGYDFINKLLIDRDTFNNTDNNLFKSLILDKSHCKIDLKSRSLIVCNRRTRIFDKRNHA